MPYSQTAHSYVVASALASASAISMKSTVLFFMLYPDMSMPRANLHGKTAIITGANSGIGYECARTFATMGAHVVLVCRSEQRGEEAKRTIIHDTGNQEVELEIMDCSSMQSVRAFVDRWGNRKSKQVDILVNNAAVFSPKLKLTVDRFEQTYQVNHLSHVLLTLLLLNRGFMASDARIISVSSCTAYDSDILTSSNVDNSDIVAKFNAQVDSKLNFSDTCLVYDRSKASQAIWVMTLQRHLSQTERWKGITVQACHPGVVNSPILSNPDGAALFTELRGKATVAFAKWSGLTNAQGATVPVWLAIANDPTLPELQGMFWSRMRWNWVWPWMLEARKQNELWKKWSRDAQVSLLI